MKDKNNKIKNKAQNKAGGLHRIYLDNAAITPISQEVFAEMAQYSGPGYANPSSIHAEGVAARAAIDSMGGAGGSGIVGARKRIADAIHGHVNEIIFTGSGTEANNLAIIGTVEAAVEVFGKTGRDLGSDHPDKFCGYSGLHMITSSVEHSSVLEAAKWLESRGMEVDYIGVDKDGVVNVDDIRKKIKSNTVLISVMHANNEIGTIQPIKEIAKMIRHVRSVRTEEGALRSGEKNNSGEDINDDVHVRLPYFHVDASQSVEYLPLDVRSFGADLVTIDGQKIYGPRGIGMLWVRRLGTKGGVKLSPIIHGGGQEQGLRSGTENTASICGLAQAVEIALMGDRQMKEAARVAVLRDHFTDGLKKIFPESSGLIFNGSLDHSKRLPNNINISLPRIDTEFFLLQLDAHGISCSTKSSCLRDEDESYVVRALGVDRSISAHSLRFSLGRSTTKKELDAVLKTISHLLSLN